MRGEKVAIVGRTGKFYITNYEISENNILKAKKQLKIKKNN